MLKVKVFFNKTS